MFVCESRECHNSIGIKNNTFDGMPPLQLNSAETFNADSIEDDREPIYQDCLVCGESQYMNDGGVYAYDDGMDQPICNKPACVSKWKQVEAAYDKGDEEGYEVYEKLFGAETAYAELGNQEFPVVPNSEGGNTALDSGYGVPQWYGSAEYEAQSITETLEEAAPVSLKKPVLVAAVSALTGFLIARRRS